MSIEQADEYLREADRLTKKATKLYRQYGLDHEEIVERLLFMKEVWDREEEEDG
jgi:hypothetical protein